MTQTQLKDLGPSNKVHEQQGRARFELIESGDPALDARAFRRCLGQFATGVAVMTASFEGSPFGMTANSFSALSLDPPLVMWSIRRESASLSLFRQAGHYGVSILAADQTPISARFSAPGPDKFKDIEWVPGWAGAPMLCNAIAHLECRLDRTIEAGDHLILIGEVQRYTRFSGDPLLFTQGRYAITQEHPGASENQPPRTKESAEPSDVDEGGLLRLLHYASHRMSSAFDSEREEEGLSVAQLRIAGWLRTKSRSLQEIRQLAYLGELDAQDTVDAMLERDELTQDAQGTLSLTPSGLQRAEAVARRSQAFEKALLKGLSPPELAAARHALATIGARAANHVTPDQLTREPT